MSKVVENIEKSKKRLGPAAEVDQQYARYDTLNRRTNDAVSHQVGLRYSKPPLRNIVKSALHYLEVSRLFHPARDNAAAQGVDQDVRCLLASNAFAKTEKDAARRQVAAEDVMFYLGRLDGRATPAQLRAQMLTQIKALTPATLGPTMTACAKRMQQSQAALQAAGRQVAPAAGR